MRDLSIKGILVGAVVVLVADIIGGVALFALIGQGREPAQLALSTPYLFWSLVIGTITTVLGGFVTAKIAKARPYMNALLLGAIGIVIGMFTASIYPLWFNIAGFASILPSSWFGAFMAKPQIVSNA